MSSIQRTVFLLLGPIVFALCYFCIPVDVLGSLKANCAIGTVCWMALWWITSPVDLAVTAFLPILLNAIFMMVDMNVIIANYSSETILLLLGASILTVAWEESNLDKRIAAKLLSTVGSNLRTQITLWFVFSAALSSILPNAVVCAAIIPIAVSMLKYAGEGEISSSKKGSLILLTIVYAAGVGGLATPLGGAMNLVTVKYIEQLTGQEYMYSDWIVRFLPIMLVLLVINIGFMLVQCKKTDCLNGSKEYFEEQYKKFAPMTIDEKLSLLLFCVATILSFTRQFYQHIFPGLKPAYIFLICASLSFLITQKGGVRLLTWKVTQKKIVWELIFVFAGGMAVGTLINATGAASHMGKIISDLDLNGGFVTVFVILFLTIVLSDITSNTATAAVAIPIVIAIVQGIGKNPIPYIYIASIGVNLSYILPTSIRAIPVGFGLDPKYMAKKGFPLTLIIIVSMSLVSYLLLENWPAFSN